MAEKLSVQDVQSLSQRLKRLRGASSERSSFSKGVSTGVQNLKTAAYGTTAVVGDLANSDRLLDVGITGFQEAQYQAAKHVGDVTDVSQIKSVADAGSWAAFTLASNLPTLATVVATGGVAGATGAAVGKAGVKAASESVIKSKVKDLAGKYVAKGLGQGEAAKLAARNIVRAETRRIANRAAMAGVGTAGVAMSTGEIGSSQYEATGEMHGVSALAAGSIAGLVDTLPIMRIFNRVGIESNAVKEGLNMQISARLSRAGKSLGKQSGLEGATEGVQTIIEQAAVDYAEGNLSLFEVEDIKELTNAIAAGMLLGGVTGIGGAISESSRFAGITNATEKLDEIEGIVNQDESYPPEQQIKNAEAAVKRAQTEVLDAVQYDVERGDMTSFTAAQAEMQKLNERLGRLRNDLMQKAEDDQQHGTVGDAVSKKNVDDPGESPEQTPVQATVEPEKETPKRQNVAEVARQNLPADPESTREALVELEAQVKATGHNAGSRARKAALSAHLMQQTFQKGDVLAGDGLPFKKPEAAERAKVSRKLPAAYEVVPIGSGYGLRKIEDVPKVADVAVETVPETKAPAVTSSVGERFAGITEQDDFNRKLMSLSENDARVFATEIGLDPDEVVEVETTDDGDADVILSTEAFFNAASKNAPQDEIAVAAAEAATSPENDLPEPTDAQKEAGNYKMGHTQVHGMDVSIENPKGSVRRGTGPNGDWESEMHSHYGYIKGTEAIDGDHVDTFIGPLPQDETLPVHVVDQVDPKTGKYDEPKVMIGFEDQEKAKAAYLDNYEKNWQGLGAITEMSIPAFKEWVHSKKAKEPLALPAPEPAKTESDISTPEVEAKNVKAKSKSKSKSKPAKGASNRVFTAEKAEAARAILKAKLGQLNAGVDPEVMQAGITLAGYHIESGARSFSAYTKAMTDDLGDMIKPYLRGWYEGIRYNPELTDAEKVGMTSPADIDASVESEIASEPEQVAEKVTAKTKEIKRPPKELLEEAGINGFNFEGFSKILAKHGYLTWLKSPKADVREEVAQAYAANRWKIPTSKQWTEFAKNAEDVQAFEDALVAGGFGGFALHHPQSQLEQLLSQFSPSPKTSEKSAAKEAKVKKPKHLKITPNMRTYFLDHTRFGPEKSDKDNSIQIIKALFGNDYVQELVDNGQFDVEWQKALDKNFVKGFKTFEPKISDDVYREAAQLSQNLPAFGKALAELIRFTPTELKELRTSGTLRRKWHEFKDNGTRSEQRLAESDQPATGVSDRGSEGTAPDGLDGTVGSEIGGSGGTDSTVAQREPGDGELVDTDQDTSEAGGVPSSEVLGSVPTSTEPGSTEPSGEGQPTDVVLDDVDIIEAIEATEEAHNVVSKTATGITTPDFVLTDPKSIIGGTPAKRFDKNREALELLETLQAENQQATPDQQAILSAYAGWGSFGQELFQGTWDKPRHQDRWDERGQWLRDRLGKDAWVSAQRSITNSHYTDPPTVQAMWDMVQRLGFTGGRVLEPAMGVGNFFSMMPVGLRDRSSLTGIELDETTGAIAKQLFPNSNVSIKGYETSQTPDDFYDLVIGNWPFENTPVADRRYFKEKPFLHDFFFLKALDQTRPGGLVIGITSKGTMDKLDTQVRRRLAEKAELVTAYRLPTGAFKEYAGTSVVTDIIVLKKREQAEAHTTDSWVQTAEVPTPAGTDVRLNQFYIDNPKNVIGTIDYGHGTTFGREGMIVHRPKNMQQRLTMAVESTPENVMTKASERISYLTNHTNERVGALTIQDGDLIISYGEQARKAKEVTNYADKWDAQLRDGVSIRQKYDALIQSELDQTKDIEKNRKALNAAYKKFVKAHGPVNGSFAEKYAKRVNDPNRAVLQALEVKQPDGTYKPASILTKPTMRKRIELKNPTVMDSYVLARNDDFAPELAGIAMASGVSVDKARKELLSSGAVFEAANGTIQPSDMFLSGDVRKKYRETLAAIEEGNQELIPSAEALKTVIPKDISYHDIEAKFGAPWVPLEVYSKYIANMLNEEDHTQYPVTYRGGKWKAKLPKAVNRTAAANSNYGVKDDRVDFTRLVNYALGNQTMVIRGTDREGNKFTDTEATNAANAAIGKMREDFNEWLWKDAERRVELETVYNETRNNIVTPKYDGSFLEMPGMALKLGNSDFDLRKHQKDAIWQAILNRRSMNAHEVGTGKSFTIAGIAIESRRYGLAQKPLIAAHNANSKALANEILMMYPGAKVKYISSLNAKVIERELLSIANDDWDAVVVPHSVLPAMSFTEDTLNAMAAEDIEILEAEIQEALEEGDDNFQMSDLDDEEKTKKLRNATAKSLVKQRQRIKQGIKAQALRSSKSNALPFEQLGIDMILVDEVQEFKKPSIATRMSMKGLNTTANDKSVGLAFMTRYIQSQNQGGNVHTFTGTYITNTLTELYGQMKYVMPQEMKDQGIDQWDGFFGSYMDEVQEVELSAAGDYELQNRLAAFVNLPELRQFVGQYMSIVFADDMPSMQPRQTKSGKVLSDTTLTEAERRELENGRTENATNRPYKKIVTVTSPMTSGQEEMFAELQKRSKRFRDATKKQRKEIMQSGGVESPIIVEGDAARTSFDLRLVDSEKNAGLEGQLADEENSKASQVIKHAMEIYHSDPNANQVIFMAQGISKTGSRTLRDPAGNPIKDANGKTKKSTYKAFSTMQDIIERLVQAGVPRDEIAVIAGGQKAEQRAEIADQMNKSEKRFVLGSISAMGIGVNMQKNLRAMHHLDAPWMPGDLVQANGRGHRQANQWNTVLEYRYLTDRLDGRRWQVLSTKDRFIKQFFQANTGQRVLEGDAEIVSNDDSSDMLETFSKAAGDPRLLTKETLKQKLKKLQAKERTYTRSLVDDRSTLKTLKQNIIDNEHQILDLQESVPKVRAWIEKPFTATIGKKTFTKPGEADKAIAQLLTKKPLKGSEQRVVGTVRGVDLVMGFNSSFSETPTSTINIEGFDIKTQAGTSIMSGLTRQANRVDQLLDERQQVLVKQKRSVEQLNQSLKEPFKQQGELSGTKAKIQRIADDIEMNPVPAPFWLRDGAQVGTTVMYSSKEFEVTGHRYSENGFFVLSDTGDGVVQLEYDQVHDDQGFRVYEDQEFVAPEVITAEDRKAGDGNTPEGGFTEADKVDTSLDYSAPAPTNGGIKPQKLNAVIKRTVKRWPNAPKIKVVRALKAIPGKHPTDERAAQNIKGAYQAHTGTVYLIADNINSELDAERILLHEMQHDSTMNTYGRNYGRQFNRLVNLIQQGGGLQRVLIEMGITKYNYDFYNDYYKSLGLNAEERAVRHIHETLSMLAEGEAGAFGRIKAIARQLIAELRSWIRANTGFKLIGSLPADELVRTMASTRWKTKLGKKPHTGNYTVGVSENYYSRAYHGTPHTVGQFTTDAIGTGEGTLNEGWGLYFTNQREIAEFYRDELSDNAKEAGNLYTVALAPRAEEYLDRTAPVGGQSQTVKNALAVMGFSVEHTIREVDGSFEVVNGGGVVEETFDTREEAQELIDDDNDGLTIGGPDGRDIYDTLVQHYGSAEKASKALLRAGVRGMVFPNGMSAGDPNASGTNYVIFDQADVTIESDYSVGDAPQSKYAAGKINKRTSPLRNPKPKSQRKSKAEYAKEKAAQVKGRVDEMTEALRGENREGDPSLIGRVIEQKDRMGDIVKRQFLGSMTRRQLVDWMARIMPQAEAYQRRSERFDADRRTLQSIADTIADKWTHLNVSSRERLAEIMHEATLAGVDPAEDYVPLITQEEHDAQIALLDRKSRAEIEARRPEGTGPLLAEKQRLRDLLAQEKERSTKEVILKGAWARLPEDAKEVYIEARDHHAYLFAETVDAIEQRIMSANLSHSKRAKAWNEIRQELEENQVQDPYFPLSRFGNYWVSVGEGAERSVETFETEAEWLRFIKRMKEEGETTREGKKIEDLFTEMNVPPEFMVALHELVDSGSTDQQDPDNFALRDSIQQLYLSTLPEMSSRHHQQHRKKVRGFAQDALRSFSDSAFHQAQSIARLRHAHELHKIVSGLGEDVQDANNVGKAQAKVDDLVDLQDNFMDVSINELEQLAHPSAKLDSTEKKRYTSMIRLKQRYGTDEEVQVALDRANQSLKTAYTLRDNPKLKAKASNYVSELWQTHHDMMNPQMSQVAAKINALGFFWYLGVSPAAAIINTTQVAMVSLPFLGSKFGVRNATAELSKAAKQFNTKEIDGKVWTNRSVMHGLKGEEKAAFDELINTGVIDITQAQDLAGLAEDGIAADGIQRKISKVVAFSFHHAERFNRETTALASYRLARKSGESHSDAVQFASDMTWKTQYDYGSTNRARFMRGNWPRVLLQFKQYSLATTFLYVDTFRKAYKGLANSPQEKAEAKKALRWLLGTQFAATGVLGLPLARAIGGVIEAIVNLFDEEDEFDYERELRVQMLKMFRVMFPESMARNTAQAFSKGVFDGYTPFSVHGRLSISELWWRSSNQELESRGAYAHFLDNALGPAAGLFKNVAFIGPGLMMDGHWQRGAEYMVPKWTKDLMQATRFLAEDATTLRGNVLMDTSGVDSLVKALGFSPSRLSDRYDENNAKRNLQTKVQRHRSRLLRQAVDAQSTTTRTDNKKSRSAIKDFNERHPDYKITAKSIKLSAAGRKRSAKEMKNGFRGNKRLSHLLEDVDFAS